MEITGNDYVIYSSVSIYSIENYFVKKLKEKWKNPIIEIETTSNRIEYYFSRDEEMEMFSNENAFSLDKYGEGIFLLIANKISPLNSKAIIIEENRDEKIKIDPYETFLLFNEVWRYTLVLPENLNESKFSADIHSNLISAINFSLKS